MSRIFARSPYYVSQSGTAGQSTSVQLRIWNGTGSAPTDPNYTLSKNIPSSVVTSCDYNISPYIQEFITHTTFANVYNTTNTSTPTNEWCNVQVKKYLDGVLQSTTTYFAYDGYSYYANEYNYDNGAYLLAQGTYYYHYDENVNYTTGLLTLPLNRAGSITFEATNGWSVVYTNLVSAATYTIALSATKIQDIFRVYPNYYADGNKVEIKNGGGTVQATYYFRPQDECKYTPIVLDFINLYGGWQREFLFKASRTNIEAQESKYNFMQPVIYDADLGSMKVFNKNGNESISANTGWVAESWNDTLKQIILSERIMINGLPATIRTQSIELNKHINDKLINYKLDFAFANSIINKV